MKNKIDEKIYRLPVNKKQFDHAIELKKLLASIKQKLYPVLQDEELHRYLESSLKRLKDVLQLSKEKYLIPEEKIKSKLQKIIQEEYQKLIKEESFKK